MTPPMINVRRVAHVRGAERDFDSARAAEPRSRLVAVFALDRRQPVLYRGAHRGRDVILHLRAILRVPKDERLLCGGR